MFRRNPSTSCIIIFSFTLLICYFVIVQYRLSSRCAELQKGLIWREELSILEQKVCEPADLARNEILDEIRTKINIDTSEYNWTVTGVHKAEDLMLEYGGKPHRTIIVAGWRTGSTFLGDLFSYLPGSFYYYEPLRYLNTTQVRRKPLSDKAVKILKSIFECKSYDVALNFIREKHLGYSRNFDRDFRRIWDYIGWDIQLILDTAFMEKMCRLFPFLIVKETVARVNVLKELMKDEELNLHMVVLVRDPRAVVQSRRHDSFCIKDPECIRPEYICADMVSDFYDAAKLLQRFPNRTRIIRFEELALNPYETTKNLLGFLRIDMTKSVEKFLVTHTKKTDSKQATVRESKEVAFKWRKLMDFKQIKEIQVACSGSMNLWGYMPAYNETHLISRSFNPLGNYSTRLRY